MPSNILESLIFKHICRLGVFCFLMAITAIPASCAFAQSLGFNEKAPVDLKSDRLEYDEKGQIVTATGNVELLQEGQKLTADRVNYNLATDTVRATGNVILTQTNGDIYYADDVELQDRMKDGFVTELYALLQDGSRFTAAQGDREAGVRLTMKDASYTPCEPCENNPDAPPLWQLVAGEVHHDKEDARISYRDARFELAGVPIAYTPYFAHPDGSVKRKSGFLTPSLQFDSQLGTGYQQDYYYVISPEEDITVGALVTTDVAPVISGEYRRRFENAHIRIDGSATYSDRKDETDGQTVSVDEEARGHIEGEAQWDINQNWRAGANLQAASDDQYMRQYDVTNDDVLENEVYAERFDDRHYAVIRAMAFQDVRVSSNQVEQPAVLPEVKARFTGAPNETLGGRWHLDASALTLFREGDDQDVARTTLEGGWQRRFIHSSGLVSRADMIVRGDAYQVYDRDVDSTTAATDDREGSSVRGFAQANFETSYPLVNNFTGGQAMLEPIASVTVGTNVNDDADIPNEDSQDVYLTSLKLFETNRFPGYDRIEDRSRATYGLRAAYQTHEGYGGEVFFGQSHRFEDNNTGFPEGSGLSEQESDYVGHVKLNAGKYLDATYRFQLEDENMSSRRHEVDLASTVGPVTLSGKYFYANAISGSQIADESREQVLGGTRIKLSDNWEVFGTARYDLGENEGLRQAVYGVDYLGQCITLSVIGSRTLTSESTGDSGTEVFFRIGLKNLGEFETSSFTIGGDDGDDIIDDDAEDDIVQSETSP